jgi:predicted membrane protein
MNRPRTLLGLILIVLGVSFFLRIDIFRLIIPALFIYLGYRLLSGETRTGSPGKRTAVKQDRINETVVFGAINRQLTATDFQGGKLTVVFGGGELDLSSAKAKAAVINLEVNAVFGGLKLIVPADWLIQTDAAAVFGGVSQPPPPAKTGKTTLSLKGAAVFGGIDIVRSR